MVIVAGYIHIDAKQRQEYLDGCIEIVRQARAAPGCLDFALSADVLDPERINILERWESQETLEAFRAEGPSGDQAQQILRASVAEYDVADIRHLT